MGEAFDIVRSGYDRIGVRYREWSSASPTRLNFVRRLLRELTPGSLVIELGCGPGEPATRLLAAEHRMSARGQWVRCQWRCRCLTSSGASLGRRPEALQGG